MLHPFTLTRCASPSNKRFSSAAFAHPSPHLVQVLEWTLADVDHVICVSNTSKENTALRAKIRPDKVRGIPPCFPFSFSPEARSHSSFCTAMLRVANPTESFKAPICSSITTDQNPPVVNFPDANATSVFFFVWNNLFPAGVCHSQRH